MPDNAYTFQQNAPEREECAPPQAAELIVHVYAIMSYMTKVCSMKILGEEEAYERCQNWERDDTEKCGERSF